VKLLHYALATGALLSLCACTVAVTPTSPSAAVTADSLIVEGFDATFFRALLQNGYESPNQLQAVRILTSPFRVYMRLDDDAGRPVPAETLDATERTLIEATKIWSGGTFGITEVIRGAGSKERVPGWITVKWSAIAGTGRCGLSSIGIDGGFIQLNSSGECSCGLSTLVYPRVVRHELGHAMGYYHTDHFNDVMYGRPITSAACDIQPSEREWRHAIIAHRQSPD
jgi:hypothetical protein